MGLHNRKAVKVVGEVRLDGQELVHASDSELRAVRGKKMAMIFQDPLSSLHPVLHDLPSSSSRRASCTPTSRRTQARERAIDDAGPGRHPQRRGRGSTTTRTSCRAACASA